MLMLMSPLPLSYSYAYAYALVRTKLYESSSLKQKWLFKEKLTRLKNVEAFEYLLRILEECPISSACANAKFMNNR